jgi:hypothetical protein
MSDQPVTETSTYTGQHNRQTSMPRVAFEPTTPATQTYALYRAATGIGYNGFGFCNVYFIFSLCIILLFFLRSFTFEKERSAVGFTT